MLKFEKNTLQGMYKRQPCAMMWLTYSYESIRWLDGKSRRQVEQWFGDDGKLQCYSLSANQPVDVSSRACVMRCVAFLGGKGLIESVDEGPFEIRLRMTAEGVEVARQCKTWWGRLGLLYQENREGLAGLAITILVSILASWATASLHS